MPEPTVSDRWYLANLVADTPEEAATGLVTILKAPGLKWIYAERMETTVLTWLDRWLADTSVPMSAWLHGRAFGPDLEVSWWRNGPAFQLRAIVEGDGSPPPAEAITWEAYPGADFERSAPQRQLLVGDRDPEAETAAEPLWSAANVGRYLAYPISGAAARVALVERVYRRKGCVVARRLIGLERVRGTI